jgi:SAM-dependent methyltransferase
MTWLTNHVARIHRSTVVALRSGLADVRPLGERPLVDLLRRERAVRSRDLERWLNSRALDDLEGAGVIERCGGETTPRIRVDLVRGLLVCSDLSRFHRARDFVVGAGPSSLLLAGYVPARAGGRLLDLGCGSGIQALLCGDANTRVTAVDINVRALGFTRLNAALNDRPHVRPLRGDFLINDPGNERKATFDTVIANPPFVLSPSIELTYRDRSLPGDAVGELTVARVASALAPGGRGYVLCNWIDRGAEWSDPVRRWTAPLSRDVTVIRIRTLGPPEYASIWTRSLPPDERSAAAHVWEASLEAEGVSRIHVGVIVLSRPATNEQPVTFLSCEATPTPKVVGTLIVRPSPVASPVSVAWRSVSRSTEAGSAGAHSGAGQA